MGTREISEADWKVLRGLRDLALDRLCAEGLREVSEASGNSGRPYDRFMKVYERVNGRNDQIAKIFDGLRRSTALPAIVRLRVDGLITDEEFNRFSPAVRETVNALRKR